MTSCKLRLGSSFEEFISTLRLDPSNTDDVRIYHVMVVPKSSLHVPFPRSLTQIASTKQSRVGSDLSTIRTRCYRIYSTARRYKLPTIEPRSISRLFCKNRRRSTWPRVLRLEQDMTWLMKHPDQTAPKLSSTGYFGNHCAKGNSNTKC